RPFVSIYTNFSMIQYLARALLILLLRRVVLLNTVDEQRRSKYHLRVYMLDEGYSVRLSMIQSLIRSRDKGLSVFYVDGVPRRLDLAFFASSPRARVHAGG
ncbi:unnamed protein product, partial [Ectocarpus sp. 12 AP-2014]